MTKKQRRSERALERVPVRVTEVSEDLSVNGFTRDISKDGLFILTRHPLRPGSKVEIELLYKDRTVALAGVVIHAARVPHHLQVVRPSGMGIEIARPPKAAKKTATSDRGPRVATDSEAVVFFGSERHLMALRDLSSSGAAIVSDFEPPQVSFMRMHVKLTATSEVMELDAVPVRSEPVGAGTLTGVRFLDPPDDVVERLEAFVNEQSRHS